jgi:tetratricopeptide (TPR) repeat protein
MKINETIQLALRHYQTGNLHEAETICTEILKIQPDNFDALHLIGIISYLLEKHSLAIKYITNAVQSNPKSADAYYNLANAFQADGQINKAINSYQKALQINPNLVEAMNNLGVAYHEIGRFHEAIDHYQKALQINGKDAEVHCNLSRSLLLLGNFEQGWKEYEWRGETQDVIPLRRNFSQPFWDGSDIRGSTILLYAEQGFGDTIQFIRYAHLVAQKGAKVILECQQELTPLLQNVEGIQQVFKCGESLPEFDMHCPLLSLPLVFRTTLESIPVKIPYIIPDNTLFRKWRDRIHNDNSKLKIGLVWAGRPEHKNDNNRSCSLEVFSLLLHFEDITFYSLQKGNAALQTRNPLKGIRIINFTDEIKDFSDTAAFIENLDLIISVDTAVAHLTGALGKPVWTLLPFVPEWRWLLNREDSPWYPTMRLFRQPAPGDWNSVMKTVSEELNKLVKFSCSA